MRLVAQPIMSRWNAPENLHIETVLMPIIVIHLKNSLLTGGHERLFYSFEGSQAAYQADLW